MENGLKSFSELLQESYSIPSYQRSYVWQTKQDDDEVRVFWNDLKDFYENGLRKQKTRYLFGPMVVYSGEKNSIIDGQQRLTTVMIFLCASRDLFKEIEIKDGKTVCPDAATDSSYVQTLIGKVYSDPNKSEINLTVARANQSFYFDEIIKPRSPGQSWGNAPNVATSNMKSTYEYLYDQLKQFVLNGKQDFEHSPEESARLYSIVHVLTHKFQVFYVSTFDLAESYHAFETLNYRGRPLEPSDLFKNYAFSRCNSDGQNGEVEELWDSMTRIVGERNLTEYIRYSWVSSHSDVTKKALFNKISTTLETPTSILNFLKELEKYSKYYAYCKNPAANITPFKNNDITSIIEDLDAMNSLLYFPVLLAMVKTGYSEDQIVSVLDRIAIYILRNTVIPQTKVKLTDHWKSVVNNAGQLSKKPDPKYVQQAIDDFKKEINSDDQFRIDLNAYIGSKGDEKKENSIPKMLLRRAFKQNGYPMPYREFELEHIYPQKPGKKAKENWPQFKPEYHDEYCYNLGNMTLLSSHDNGSIKNKSFSTKKAVYANSPLCDNKEIATLSDWTPDQITDRKSRIIDKIIEKWR